MNENVTEVGTANAEPDSLIAVPSTGVLVEGSELTPEERKKQKKKVKKSQYKARKKQRAAEAAAGEANSTSDIDTEEATPEPTTQAEENNHSKAAAVGLAAAGTGAAAATIAATTALADHPDTLGSTTNGDILPVKILYNHLSTNHKHPSRNQKILLQNQNSIQNLKPLAYQNQR